MNKFLYIMLLISTAGQLFGQQDKGTLRGKVSFISSGNIYVKFISTKDIQKGDTLYFNIDNSFIPVLRVFELSSISCVCNAIGERLLKISDEVMVLKKTGKTHDFPALAVNDTPAAASDTIPSTNIPRNSTLPKEPIVKGRFAFSSYSNLLDNHGINNTRLRYTLALNISRIESSKLSAETYVSYSHNTNDLSAEKSDIFNYMKIYNLALKYSPSNHLSIWAGRKINQKISGIGAIDGLQAELKSKNFFIGAIAGSRPDYLDYSFNFNLIEYGAYIGQHYFSGAKSMQSTAAFFQQNNNGKTDRRFIYLQHDNSLAKNLNLFVSSEIDLYKIENGLPQNTFSLTSLYISLGYRVNRKFSLFGSYDERKNIIYYETFKSYLDQLIENVTRQGMRFRINYRPGKIVNIGVSAGHQFRDNDIKPSDNVNGYLTFNQLPWKNGSATLSTNLIKTSYLDGKIAGLKIYQDLFSGFIYAGLGYQFMNYEIIQSETSPLQHTVDLDLSVRFNKKLTFSVNVEKTFENLFSYTHIYTNIVRRF